jgi:predicted secreted protein
VTYPIRINFTILMATAGHRWSRVNVSALILLYLVFIVLLLSSGCVRHDAGFVVRPEAFLDIPDIYADEATSHVTMSVGDTMLVSYPWTPEDGRFWRVGVTDGLFVSGDRYIPYPSDMPVEVTGTREWMVRAVYPGDHTFIGNLRPRTASWNQDSIQQVINVKIRDDGKNMGA